MAANVNGWFEAESRAEHANELVEVLRLNREQIASAREKTREELKFYSQGRGNLTFVIQSRDSEERAKSTYAENALTYQKLVIQYLALTDDLYRPLPAGGESEDQG